MSDFTISPCWLLKYVVALCEEGNAPPSEDHLQRKLNLSRRGRRRCDSAYIGNRRLRCTGRVGQRAHEDAPDGGRDRKIRVVQQVEDFRAKLQFGALTGKRPCRIFVQREIPGG